MKRFLLAIALLFCALTTNAQIKTITGGGFQKPDGTACVGCVLFLQLSSDATVSGSGQIIHGTPKSYILDASGNVPANSTIWGNDQFTATGTYYAAALTFPGGGGTIWGPIAWSLVGTSPINLSQVIAVNPSPIGIPNPALLAANNAFTGNNTHSGTETFSGTPSINLLAAVGDTAALYGINNANLALTNTPVGAQTFTDFRQYCPPTNDPRGNFGCGVYINRWLNGQDETNFFFQSPFNTGVVAYNSGLTAAITSAIRNGSNVMTITTASQVSLRPTVGDVNIVGLTCPTGTPNGHFVPTVVDATHFTYPNTGSAETCTVGSATASPAGRTTFVFQRNDNNNNVLQNWYLSNDCIGDRSDQLCVTQLPADAVNGAGRFRSTLVNPILNLLGVGNAAALVDWQTLVDGNMRVSGSVISASSYQENPGIASGLASFGWRTLAAKQTWFSAIGSNGNGTADVALNSTRGFSGNGFWRFDMSGGGILYTSASDGGAGVPFQPFYGLLIPATAPLKLAEGTAPPASASNDVCYGDSTAHAIECSYNNGTFGVLPLLNRAQTWTALQTFSTGNLNTTNPVLNTVSITGTPASGNLAAVIASGTSTMASGSVAAATCATAVTTAATNTATTDAIEWAYATAPTLTTDALLHISPYVTSGNVNFTRCNPTAGAIVGTAIVINWRVIR